MPVIFQNLNRCRKNNLIHQSTALNRMTNNKSCNIRWFLDNLTIHHEKNKILGDLLTQFLRRNEWNTLFMSKPSIWMELLLQ